MPFSGGRIRGLTSKDFSTKQSRGGQTIAEQKPTLGFGDIHQTNAETQPTQ